MIVIYALLVYLVFLRRNKIKAEEWLETHRNTIFNHGSNYKTEEEVIEALVQQQELNDLQAKGGSQVVAGEQDDGNDSDKSDGEGKSNKLLP